MRRAHVTGGSPDCCCCAASLRASACSRRRRNSTGSIIAVSSRERAPARAEYSPRIHPRQNSNAQQQAQGHQPRHRGVQRDREGGDRQARATANASSTPAFLDRAAPKCTTNPAGGNPAGGTQRTFGRIGAPPRRSKQRREQSRDGLGQPHRQSGRGRSSRTRGACANSPSITRSSSPASRASWNSTAHLEVEAEAAVVEVRAADDDQVVVDQQRLAVQHARAVLVDAHAGGEQLVEVRTRRKRDQRESLTFGTSRRTSSPPSAADVSAIIAASPGTK